MSTAQETHKWYEYKRCWLKDITCGPHCILFREGCLLLELLKDIASALRELRW